MAEISWSGETHSLCWMWGQWVILSVDLFATYLTEDNCAEKTCQDWNAS